MKKVLIWDLFQKVDTGGPSGYLYNLQQYLLEHPTEQISFFSDLITEQLNKYGLPPSKLKPHGSSKTRISQLWRRFVNIYNSCIFPFRGVEFHISTDIDISEYDFVHIHQVTHFQQFRQLFPNYKGKVIITSHSPCPFSDELIERAASEKAKLYKWIQFIKPVMRKYLISKECEAYDNTDYVMFPCAGAREPYEKDVELRKVFARNSHKFFYVPTAIMDYSPNIHFVQKLADFNIPKDAFVITYFGRHNLIKGYDILKRVGMHLLEKIPNLYFLCAGNGPIERPQHPRWVELGFIDNVNDLLPQGDLYILPNRETYFDLITLQILRAGVPLILSNTGGNKHFKGLQTSEAKGLMFFDINNEQSIEELVIFCHKLNEDNKKEYRKLGEANQKLFRKYFTLDRYFSRYIESINSLQL